MDDINEVEWDEGWELGQEDFYHNRGCRFQEGHSHFAMGYFAGYYSAAQYSEQHGG